MEAEALKRIRQQDEFDTATLQMILAKQEQMKKEYVQRLSRQDEVNQDLQRRVLQHRQTLVQMKLN